jgi:hypothetical protein
VYSPIYALSSGVSTKIWYAFYISPTECLGEYLDLRFEEVTGGWRKLHTRSFVIFTLHEILLGKSD